MIEAPILLQKFHDGGEDSYYREIHFKVTGKNMDEIRDQAVAIVEDITKGQEKGWNWYWDEQRVDA